MSRPRAPKPFRRAGEHMCLRSSIFWRFGQPKAVCSDQGIGEEDELAGDGDQGKLALLSAGGEATEEGFHVAIAACGAERGKIENDADRMATAADMAGALARAGNVGAGRETAEPGGSLVLAAG